MLWKKTDLKLLIAVKNTPESTDFSVIFPKSSGGRIFGKPSPDLTPIFLTYKTSGLAPGWVIFSSDVGLHCRMLSGIC